MHCRQIPRVGAGASTEEGNAAMAKHQNLKSHYFGQEDWDESEMLLASRLLFIIYRNVQVQPSSDY